tara:strand:- start:263 stop:994 length:732 start_codon:yes stop_codon:yes gene_type:complete
MISIDTVYQKVLAIANKEQRGYITPQEFNLLAAQAQQLIFEQYFYDLNQFNRAGGNGMEYSDMMNILEEKISLFETYNQNLASNTANRGKLPADCYRLGQVQFGTFNGANVVVEKLNTKDLNQILNTALTAPTLTRPVYIRSKTTTYDIELYPTTFSTSNRMDDVTINYIKKPTTPKWTYTIVNEQALYNGSASDKQDFELHPSDEEDLVYKILELSGIIMNKPGLVQLADKEEMQGVQNEKM